MQTGSRGYSLVQDSGTYQSSCGYCNDEGGLSSEAHGMHAYRLTVYDYQELLDQGWRRSGKYLYKPDNKVTCCRQYTIRLKVSDFQASKSHKKLLRKWEQFLAGHIQQQERQGDRDLVMTSCTQQQQQPDSNEVAAQQHRGSKRSRNSSSVKGKQSQSQQHQVPSCAWQGDALQQHPADLQSFASISNSSRSSNALCSQVQALLQQAAVLVAHAGQLPQQGMPAVKVIIPPQQKAPKLPAGTAFTSSSAHALAAAARKALQQQQQQQQPVVDDSGCSQQIVSADALAHALVRHFNELAAAQPAVGFLASAVNGHVNFVSVQQQALPEQQQEQLQPEQQHRPSSACHEPQQHRPQPLRGHQQPQQPPNQQQQQDMHLPAHVSHPQQQQRRQQQQEEQQGHLQHQQEEQIGLVQQQPEDQQPEQQQQQRYLEVRMVPNQFIQEEYELYCKYQVSQHADDPQELTPSRYRHFLVDTPLIPVRPQQQNIPPASGAAAAHAAGGGAGSTGAGGGIPACGYGSFHQQYWLDGRRLIAVGVVDVLPRCLSSKYFFWDPDYAWLSLGRYGALREIAWIEAAHAAGAAQLQYYYLGYYIHNCPKMAYKAEYVPSELLCPERQVWVKIDKTVLQALDSTPYVVLSNLPSVQMEPNCSVPRHVPSPVTAASGSSGSSGREQLVQRHTRLLQRQQLDSQLMFLKQPVRWGALKESGLLDEVQIGEIEERLTAWRAAVGETAAYLLYATPSDVLPGR